MTDKDNGRKWAYTLGGATALGLLTFFMQAAMPPERKDINPILFVDFGVVIGAGAGLAIAKSTKPKP